MKSLLAEILKSENTQEDSVQLEDIQTEAVQGVLVGRLILAKKTGHMLIDYPGNPFGPLRARSTVRISDRDGNREVVLIFEDNNPRLPIIIGVIQDEPVATSPPQEVILDRNEAKEIIVDKERIVLDAKKEILLRCGEGSVTIGKDGKIVIKGTNLLSRAKGVNRIKGAAVNIN
jgi:hypothetical protein